MDAPRDLGGSAGERHLTDRFGALAGAVCAVHCAATIPLAGLLSFDAGLLGPGAEHGFALLAASLVVLSSVHGYRHHRSASIVSSFFVFLLVWIAGTLLAAGVVESTLHVIAALGLTVTHVISLKRLKGCTHSGASHR